MKNKPVFSVIIPLYNKEKYISRAINSVLKQSFKDFEIIVVNDGSTDNSLSVLKTIKDSRIRILNQKNLGASNARNKGIKKTKAPYIAFLDADDEYLPDFLSNIYELMQKYKKYSFFATAYKRISSDSIKECYYGAKKISIVENFLAKMAKTGKIFIHISSVVIKKNVFDDVGGFFTRSKKNYGGATIFEDIDLWIRISCKYNMVFLNKIETIYYTNTQTNTINGYKFSRLDCSFYEHTMKKLLTEHSDKKIHKHLRQILYYLRNASATQFFIRGYFAESQDILNKQPKTKAVKKMYKMIKIKEVTNKLIGKVKN